MQTKVTAVRITAETFERYQRYAANYDGVSASAMVEMVLSQVADMIDAEPAARCLPRFIQVLDLAKRDPVPLSVQRPVKPSPARN